MKQVKLKIILLTIILLGFFLRFYGINWDKSCCLHPDERAIVMFTTPLKLPVNISEFLSITSPLNPHFFAYGSFPLYLLKSVMTFTGFINPVYASYQIGGVVGRNISIAADLATLFLVFLIGKKLFDKKIGLFAAFFYSLSVFPIQASHFYAVDILLTFFIILTLYQLIRFYENPSIKNSLFVGIFFGFALATKISAIPLIAAISFTITADFILVFIKQPHKIKSWLPHLPRTVIKLIKDGFVISSATFLTFIVLEPYALIDFQEFLKQSLLQSQMTKNAFIFPYTLQYVGKIPYLYELKNVFLWGMGPVIATFAFLGFLNFFYLVFKKETKAKDAKQIIIFIFFIVYFLIVGKFAVGWMRYMLPLYPLLSIFAGMFIVTFLKPKLETIKNKIILNTLYLILYTLTIVWPLSFIQIYTKPNTRITASEWIYKNIPPNSIIAKEHWDDGLPIGGTVPYQILELPIYEIENPLREEQIYQTIQKTNYIIIASNRLYVPLQRLSKNCRKWNLPQERCANNANKYYEKLFSGELGYKKVAEFTNYPKVPFTNIEINDESADESFTVYDHPKIMIFKKISNKS
ncbi:MAG: hypothetical protein CO136_03315 [Candidatus Levybacteria bacterium CG_4_9_14_3_um_filter_36_7]|nr:MAG: hypothetical protein CO136_03315 [Candidatus Levybacteria bacterium CG_4_9_14_3_um_filter_36_7]